MVKCVYNHVHNIKVYYFSEKLRGMREHLCLKVKALEHTVHISDTSLGFSELLMNADNKGWSSFKILISGWTTDQKCLFFSYLCKIIKKADKNLARFEKIRLSKISVLRILNIRILLCYHVNF